MIAIRGKPEIAALRHLKRRARKMKRQLWALFLAWKDPATPLLARVAIACAIAYAASPVDLIPDFIPVLGLLDDIVIVPALVALALRLIPRARIGTCFNLSPRFPWRSITRRAWEISISRAHFRTE